MGETDASPPPAGSGLDHYGIAELAGNPDRVGDGLDGALGVRRHRHVSLAGELLGLDLVAEQLHVLDSRADELDLAVATDLGKVGVLGQEAVARVNGLDVGNLSGGDDARDVEVAFGRRARSDTDPLVGKMEIARRGVGLGEHGHRLDAQFLAGADDPQSDFAAIGYENT